MVNYCTNSIKVKIYDTTKWQENAHTSAYSTSSTALAKVQHGKHHQHIINGNKNPDAKKKSILLSTC